jgi:glyoxylase-like metal-dependent hydrolase (beta-lactamase superfamily II)
MQRSPTLLACVAIIAAAALAACSRTEEAAPPAATASDGPAAGSPPAATQPNVHAFKIGELSALALRDGGIELANDNKVFGVGRTPEEVAAVLSAAGLPTDKLRLTIQPLLVKTADRVMLFDTGAGPNFGPGAGQLSAALAEAGVDPKNVSDIFISHVHGDHVGGLVDAEGRLVFPNATIRLSKPEWDFLTGQQAQAALVAAIKPRVEAFKPGAELIPGVVQAVDIKGHTPGHSGYQITSGQDSLLYVGDAMHHYVVSVQKPEWTIAFDGDAATASASRAALISGSAASGQRIYAVHFPFPGIGKLEQRATGFAWVAE